MAAIGLDFGTTTTGLAAYRDRQVSPLANEAGQDQIPSVWACTPTGKIQIGVPAKRRILIDPENTLHSVKRLIGRHAKSSEFREFQKKYNFQTVVDENDRPRFRTRLGDLTPENVATQILAYARAHFLADELGPARTTVTIPVAFDDEQRQHILDAVNAAHFEHLDVISEPYAAALGYLSGRREAMRVAVYDLGGGTFDFAVLEWSGKDAVVLGVGGDPYLGGDDIDTGLFEWASRTILAEYRWDVRTDPRACATLRLLCEQAKIQLSAFDETWIALGSAAKALDGQKLHLTRSDLQTVITPLLQRSFLCCDRVLSDARCRPSDFDAVVCVGGCANIPAVSQGVEAYFGVKTETGIPPERVVVLGAAYHAGTRHRAQA